MNLEEFLDELVTAVLELITTLGYEIEALHPFSPIGTRSRHYQSLYAFILIQEI